MTTVFTIGHSTREANEFNAILGAAGVEVLVDVRRHPGSRRVPWTNPGSIETELDASYVHLPELGGRRKPAPDSPNGYWDNAAFRGYADHMSSSEFGTGLARLLELAADRSVAVMCAEAPWWRCHRRLLADALVARGHEVMHLGLGREPQPHRLTEAAVLRAGSLSYPPAQTELDI